VGHPYRPELDGLRTVAVYLVVLFHTGLAAAAGGFIGVDLFFVLSGFLVSGVVLAEIDRTGRLSLWGFYARRVRRLLPAAVLVVVATTVTFTVLWSEARRVPLVGDARSALLYYANWHFLGATGDYFATDVDKSPFLHFWSLAIEEQFYLVFPVLLVLLVRGGRRFTLGALAVLLALSLAAQLTWARVDADHAYYGTDARLYQLLAGALLTVALRGRARRDRPGALPARTGRLPDVLAATGLLALVALGSGLVEVSPSTRGIAATAGAVAVLAGLSWGAGGVVSRLLGLRIPVFLGRISYGTYLWHWPVIVALTTVLTTSPLVVAVVAVALSTGLAALSYEVLEMPVRRSTALDRLRAGTAVAGVAASALVAVTLVPALLHSDRRPVLTAAGSDVPRDLLALAGAAAEQPVPSGIDWAAVAGGVGVNHSCPADRPGECTVVRGQGPHVLVVGDSQAQMLLPMFERMARDHDLTLSANVVAGCPWQEDLQNAKLSTGGSAACTAARVGWYDEALPVLDPDVVILVERPRDDPAVWGDLVSRRDGRDQPLARAVLETSRDTLAKIAAVAGRTAVVRRLVMPESFDPTDCLSSVRRVGDCAVAVPTGSTPSDGYVAAIAAGAPTIRPVDLTHAFCPTAPVCLPVAGDTVVWRDDHHYTATYALQRRAAVWRALVAAGVLRG
jgi:peptidoglycan/LPS O-acetylase OafA/YrhL